MKRLINLIIRKAKHLYPPFFKYLSTPIVIFLAVIFIMLRTVYLNRYFYAISIKIHYIITDNLLPLKF